MSERDYLIAKARSWKNISQYEDERGQGRATARNGKSVAGAGGTAVVAGGALSQYSPQTFGTVPRAFDSLNELSVQHKKNRATVARAWGGQKYGLSERLTDRVSRRMFGGDAFPEAARASERAARLSSQARDKELKALGKIVRRNPGPAVQAAGVGAMGLGGAMWAGGRLKARNAEHNIARLRRERDRKRA